MVRVRLIASIVLLASSFIFSSPAFSNECRKLKGEVEKLSLSQELMRKKSIGDNVVYSCPDRSGQLCVEFLGSIKGNAANFKDGLNIERSLGRGGIDYLHGFVARFDAANGAIVGLSPLRLNSDSEKTAGVLDLRDGDRFELLRRSVDKVTASYAGELDRTRRMTGADGPKVQALYKKKLAALRWTSVNKRGKLLADALQEADPAGYSRFQTYLEQQWEKTRAFRDSVRALEARKPRGYKPDPTTKAEWDRADAAMKASHFDNARKKFFIYTDRQNPKGFRGSGWTSSILHHVTDTFFTWINSKRDGEILAEKSKAKDPMELTLWRFSYHDLKGSRLKSPFFYGNAGNYSSHSEEELQVLFDYANQNELSAEQLEAVVEKNVTGVRTYGPAGNRASAYTLMQLTADFRRQFNCPRKPPGSSGPGGKVPERSPKKGKQAGSGR